MAAPITEQTVGGITGKILTTDYPFDWKLDVNGPGRTITYMVAGADAVKFANALRGIGNYTGTIFRFPTPHQYPNNPNCFCVSARLGGHLGADAPSQFGIESSDQTAIVATYEPLVWDVFGTDYQDLYDGYSVPWSSTRIHVGHEDHQAKDIVLATAIDPVGGRVRVPLVTYEFSRTMIPAVLPYKTICAALAGKVNDATFFGEARGTVRFDSFGMDEQDRDPSGQRVWAFSLQLSWRPLDWNKFLAPGTTNSWQLPADSGNYPYPYASFLPIIRYGLA